MNYPRTTDFIGWMAGLAAVAIWGLTFVSTDALLSDFTPMEILLGRLAFALGMLGIPTAKSPQRTSMLDHVAMSAMALTGIVVYQYLESKAIALTDASNIAIVMAAGPFVTTIMVGRFCGERRPKRRFFIGAGIAAIGILVMSVPARPVVHFCGDTLAVLAMMSWAIYSVLLTYLNDKDYDPVFVIRRVCTYAFAFTIPFALPSMIEGPQARCFTPLNLFNLAFLGIFGSGVAFVLWSFACRRVGTAKATLLTYLTPIVTCIAATIFCEDTLLLETAFGILLVLIGLIVADFRNIPLARHGNHGT